VLASPKQLSTTQSFIAASEEFEEVCAWLERIGVGFSATRVGRYKALFAAMAEAQRTDDLEGLFKKNTPMDFLNAIVERAQLMRIYSGLHELSDEMLVGRLKKAFRSHALYVMDSEHRSGRDFSLELDVAAKFARNGFEIDFGHDADVKATKGNFQIFVECKRLKSENKVRENIAKGLKQLKNRYKASLNSEACRGVLVLSVAKIHNPRFEFLLGQNVEDIGEQCAAHVDSFLTRHSRYWHHTGVDQRTLGVALIFDAPGRTLQRNIPFSLHEVAFDNVVATSSPDYPRFVELMGVFGPYRRVRP